MRRLVSISVAGLFLFIISVGVVYAGPTAISPSSDTVAVVPTGCTTFSWSEVSGAVSYRLEVYEAVTSNILSHKDAMATGAPLLVGDIDAPGLSWTPTVDRCLSEGKVYVWYVGARDSEGNLTWSEGKAFEVRALSEAAMQEAVRGTVKEYLKTEWKNTDSFSQFKEEIKKEVTKGIETEGNKKIMGTEGTSNTLYGLGAGNSLGDDDDYATFIGYQAGYSTLDGITYNTFVGHSAGYSNTTGYWNTFMGRAAGYSNTTGNYNTFIGNWAGGNNQAGSNNIFIGAEAGYYNTASDNTVIGRLAGHYFTTASGNTIIGKGAGRGVSGSSTGGYNTFVGYEAGYGNTTGSANTFVGNSSGHSNTTGQWNVFVGDYAGYSNTTGSYNTFVGLRSGRYNQTGYNNAFFGKESGENNTASENTFIGHQAGRLNTSGSSNVFLGSTAGYTNQTGVENTFLGFQAGYYNTASFNTFVGSTAGYSNTTGSQNTFLGDDAGLNNTTGSQNTFLGDDAGLNNTSGKWNTFVGESAGRANTTANYNVFIGQNAGYNHQTGGYNTFIGSGAGYNNQTGQGNVFIGNAAGTNETGSNKLYIDNSGTSTPLIWGDFTNDIVNINGKLGIGTTAPDQKIDLAGGAITVNGSDTSAGTGTGQQRPMFGWTETGRAIMGWGGAGGANMEFYSRGHTTRPGEYYIVYGGGPTIGKVRYAHYDGGTTWSDTLAMLHNGYIGFGVPSPVYPLQHKNGAYLSTGGVWTNASSREYKENIEPLSADKAIEALKGLNPVTYTYKAAPDERHVGFIAEDVPDLVATKDRKSLSPMDIVAVLTRVTKEQQSEIERLKGVIQKLEAQNKKLEAENQATREEFKDKIAYIERLLLFQNSIAASK